MSHEQVRVLIPAAGQGLRFGGAILKQYLPVNGKAVLAHAIRAFLHHPSIAGITVAVSEGDQMFEASLGSLASAVETAPGGDTRSHSVRNGLQHIRHKHPDANWVMVHDAARPCLSRECLDRLLENGLQHAYGAILAVPVGDTLKRAGEHSEIMETVDRSGLWAAQTPQMFRIRELMTAMDAAYEAGREVTDEASAMEFAGARPGLVMGSAANIKITHPDDLVLAEALLKATATTV